MPTTTPVSVRPRCLIEGAGDSEVGHQGRAVGRQEQIFGLDVAVDDPVPVGELEGTSGFGRDPERLDEGKLAVAAETLAEALPFHIGHREPEVAPDLSRIEYRQNVRMLQPGRELDLALESLRTERGRDRGQEHLERDEALMLDVAGEIHRRHAASAELALDEVAIGQGVAKTGWDLGQWVCPGRLGGCATPM